MEQTMAVDTFYDYTPTPTVQSNKNTKPVMQQQMRHV